ncbi:MAG: hypothetical protein HXY38_02060 [Chloroflexi bacterium]|nr:hypothetical protein [Chloroflexota bacterium]
MKIKPHLEESFQYRSSILMKEIELTDKAIERIDDITQTVKTGQSSPGQEVSRSF